VVNGIHDMGGMQGFGRVERDPDDPPFHADWERNVIGINMATLCQGLYDVDENRYARELMEPHAALTSSYFAQLYAAMETCLVDHGVVSYEEIDARAAEFLRDPDRPVERPSPEAEAEVLSRVLPLSRQRTVQRAPRFAVGDEVTTRRTNPVGHTRLPRYARGRTGVVTVVHNAYVLPDTNAHDLGEQPEHLYQVRFEASELWGDDIDGPGTVAIDVWESYLL
jgi:nitrile hydratase beta subunit